MVVGHGEVEKATLEADTGRNRVDRPHRVNGFKYQILEVERCLREKLVESPVVSWSCSVWIGEPTNTIRAEIGVRYPADDEVHYR